MSGGVKAGLIFGLIAIPISIVMSFIPIVGVFCCGPLGAMGLGAGAGYLAVRWGAPDAKIGQGVLSGALTGIGSLIGSVLFFLIASRLPGFDTAMQQMLEQQNSTSQLTAEDIQAMVGIALPLAGGCIGLIGLLFALGGGALGAWLYLRKRPADVPPVPPIPPVSVG